MRLVPNAATTKGMRNFFFALALLALPIAPVAPLAQAESTAASTPPPGGEPKALQPSARAKSRPMSEMQGGCGDYEMSLKEEFRFWKLAPITLSTSKGTAGRILPLGRRVRLTLEENQEWKHPPAKTPKDPFGAIIPLRVATSGLYRIALGGRAWVDLLEAKQNLPVKEAAFEMQTACPSIFKVVVFPLEGGRDYLLQLSSAPGNRFDLSFSRVPAAP